MEKIKAYIKANRKYFIMALVAAALFGICAIIGAVLRSNSALAESVFVPLAKGISSVLRAPINLLPFSMVELCVGALLLLIAFVLVMLLISLVRFIAEKVFHKAPKVTDEKEEERGSVIRAIGSIALAISILFTYFSFSYGFVFNRPDIDRLLGLNKGSYTAKQLLDVSLYLSEKATVARAALPDSVDPAAFEYDFSRLRDDSIAAFEKLAKKEPVFDGFLTKPKKVIFGKWMSYLGIAGMYAPFFSESSISADAIMASIPYTVTHELGHSVMFGREDEANFIAFLATIDADDPLVRYSGYYRALGYCGNALYRADKELYKELYVQMSPEVKHDRKIESDHVDSYSGASVEIAQKYNDTFIKATGQEHGVESYGMVVDLILAYYDKNGMN